VLGYILDAVAPAGERVDVVALSLPGQYVAARAVQEPHRFRRLVLISPTGFGRFARQPGGRGKVAYAALRVPPLGAAFYALVSSMPSIRYFLGKLFKNPRRLPEAYMRYSWLTAHQPGARHAPLAFVTGQLNRPGAREAYERLPVPALLLFGDQPSFSDPGAALGLVRANSNIQVELMPDCGDLPQYEQPDATVDTISTFLSAPDPTP
jgi:pimeloyl-ACP methyl ester carboxylesterase